MVTLAACSAQQQPENSTAQPEDTAKQTGENRETIYQVALLQSLTRGYYDGIIKVSELKEHGDVGIGTFEGVNGEMIVLDGTYIRRSATAVCRLLMITRPYRSQTSHSLIRTASLIFPISMTSTL